MSNILCGLFGEAGSPGVLRAPRLDFLASIPPKGMLYTLLRDSRSKRGLRTLDAMVVSKVRIIR